MQLATHVTLASFSSLEIEGQVHRTFGARKARAAACGVKLCMYCIYETLFQQGSPLSSYAHLIADCFLFVTVTVVAASPHYHYVLYPNTLAGAPGRSVRIVYHSSIQCKQHKARWGQGDESCVQVCRDLRACRAVTCGVEQCSRQLYSSAPHSNQSQAHGQTTLMHAALLPGMKQIYFKVTAST